MNDKTGIAGSSGVYAKIYREVGAGGFTRFDGTIQFFGRVNALLEPHMQVLDFGAGRGAFAEFPVKANRELPNLKGKVARVVGLDQDQAVRDNPTLDEAVLFDGKKIPFADETFDLIVSDHAFEHIPDPATTSSELYRVLKPGGWLCARTPYILSLVALAARAIPNRHHARVLRTIQPHSRAARDVFPTRYRLNSHRALAKYFPREQWEHCSYTWNTEPTYHFGSPLLVRVMRVIHYLKAAAGGEVLMVFLRKRTEPRA